MHSQRTNLRRSGGSGFRTLDSRVQSVIRIATKIVSLGPWAMPYPAKKFRQNPFTSFRVIRRTDRQTDRTENITSFFGGGNHKRWYYSASHWYLGDVMVGNRPTDTNPTGCASWTTKNGRHSFSIGLLSIIADVDYVCVTRARVSGLALGCKSLDNVPLSVACQFPKCYRLTESRQRSIGL